MLGSRRIFDAFMCALGIIMEALRCTCVAFKEYMTGKHRHRLGSFVVYKNIIMVST